MIDMQCAEVRDAAAEFALDILEPAERSAVAAHILRCPDCRAEVDSLGETAGRLLDLVPGTEPPLGFDRRVMARVGDPTGRDRVRRRRRVGVGAAAAVLIVLGTTLGVVESQSSPPATSHVALARFVEGGHAVGQIEVYGGRKPPWVAMNVRGVAAQGTVSCELIDKDGTVIKLGSFDLINGSGQWGAPDRWSKAHITEARLVDSTGRVVAVASF